MNNGHAHTLRLARADRAPVPGTVGDVNGQDDSSLSNLALILAHRLRGLVLGIEGYTDLLIDSLHDREQRDLAMRILESTAQIERVLSDLQRYSRPVIPVPYRLRLREVIENLFAALEEGDLERIQFEIQGLGERELVADPVLLRQALLVLLQNALDATRQGGAVVFRIGRDAFGEAVCFEVQNEGWIPLEKAEELIFTPFFTTKAHNLGVGLTIARRIAEAHGGTLVLKTNSATDGTCFVLSLPAGAGGAGKTG